MQSVDYGCSEKILIRIRRPKREKLRENEKLLEKGINFFYTPPPPKQIIMDSVFNDECRIFFIGPRHELVNSFTG
jgi:hypothetical protein